MKRRLPLFPLNTVLFPGGPLTLRIFETRYVDMISRCMRDGSGFGVTLLTKGNEAATPEVTTAPVGTEARIVDFDRLDDGLLGLTCIGGQRIRILERWQEADGLHMAIVEDVDADPRVTIPEDCAHLGIALRHLYPQLPPFYGQWVAPEFDDASWVANRLAELAPFDAAIRQGLLEMTDPVERLRHLSPLVRIEPRSADQTRSGRPQ